MCGSPGRYIFLIFIKKKVNMSNFCFDLSFNDFFSKKKSKSDFRIKFLAQFYGNKI